MSEPTQAALDAAREWYDALPYDDTNEQQIERLATLLTEFAAEAVERRVKKAEDCLKTIRDYEPNDVCFDQFTYDRMVEGYRDAAKAGLAAIRGEQP